MGQNTLAIHSFTFENLPRIMESAGIRFGNAFLFSALDMTYCILWRLFTELTLISSELVKVCAQSWREEKK